MMFTCSPRGKNNVIALHALSNHSTIHFLSETFLMYPKINEI